MKAIRTATRFGDRTVKLKWVIPAYILIFAVAWGLFIANTTYSRDKAEQAERAAALVAYDTKVNAYEQCTRRVDSRTEIRGMFTATFDAIEEQAGPNSGAFLDTVRARLDTNYPAVDPSECIPPGDPPSLEE